MKFKDIETGEILNLGQLKCEYNYAKNTGLTEALTFEEYLNNCMTRNNGTLEVIECQ